MEKNSAKCNTQDFIVLKALEGGAQAIGMTRGGETRPHHTENLNAGEVLILQFTENVAAIKIRGNAVVMTKYGSIEANR
jgi:transcription attenuation protein (tryptophan RNA-binding attenuator protein)